MCHCLKLEIHSVQEVLKCDFYYFTHQFLMTHVIDEFGSVESVKSASSLYCPVSGDVTEVNEKLDSDQNGDPSLVNKSPYDEGYRLKVLLL
jgi:glycine cleavage system H lipoate-binding protein